MELDLLNLIQTVGFPVAIVIYYLMVEKPKQENKYKEVNEKVFGLLQNMLDLNQQILKNDVEKLVDNSEIFKKEHETMLMLLQEMKTLLMELKK